MTGQGGTLLQPADVPGLGPVQSDFWVYTIALLAIAAGQSVTASFTVGQEADFELDKLAFFADDNSGNSVTESTMIMPLVTLKMQDTGASRPIVDDNTPLAAIFGRGEIPFILPRPKIILRGATVNVTGTNFSAATTYNVRLCFIGQKLFQNQPIRV